MPTVTLTPIPGEGVYLDLVVNRGEFRVSDPFYIAVDIGNTTEEPVEGVFAVLFEVLERYYWWPDYEQTNEYLAQNCLYMYLEPGCYQRRVLYNDIVNINGPNIVPMTIYGGLVNCAGDVALAADEFRFESDFTGAIHDTVAPIMLEAYPAAGSSAVVRDARLTYLLEDRGSNPLTASVAINGETMPAEIHAIFSRDGLNFSFFAQYHMLTCSPPSPLPPEAAVDIRVEVTDLGGNTLIADDLGFTVGVEFDTEPPVIVGSDPADGSLTDIRGEWVIIELADTGSGVDWNTVRLTEGGVAVPFDLYHSPARAIIRHHTRCEYDWGDVVLLTVEAHDYAGNWMLPRTITYVITDPGFTATPTATPRPTRTPTPTVTPEPPPTPTGTPVQPTNTPSPTPLPAAGAHLTLAASGLSPGERLLVTLGVSNPGPARCAEVYAALDAGSGSYWFWPSWSEYPPTADSCHWILEASSWREETLLDFPWPSGSGDGQFRIWAAAVDYLTGELFGAAVYVDVTFHESY